MQYNTRMRLVRFLIRSAALALLAAVLILSLTPIPPQPVVFDGVDKIEHALAYAALTLLLCLGFLRSDSKPLLGTAFAAPVFLLSAAIEAIQPFVGRTFDWFDMGSNAFGALTGWLLWLVTRKIRKRQSVCPGDVSRENGL